MVKTGRPCPPFQRGELGRPIIPADPASIYGFGLLIRKTEELLLRLFSQGLLSGTTHTCLGEELSAISVVRALGDPTDAVFSNHRNHGHFLAYSGNFVGLVAEIMGRAAGVCGGVGGSQHIAFQRFHSNGIQGGMTGIGVGQAMAIQRRGENGIVAIMIGDGTLGQGLLYESMNLASIWGAPVLYVVENNAIAQTTPTAATVAGSILGRGQAFGLDVWELDDSAADFIAQAECVVQQVRSRRKPGLLAIHTRRLGPHSKGDDMRDAAEMAAIRERDPLERLGRQLDAAARARIEAAAADFVAEVHAEAAASPEADPLQSTPVALTGPQGATVPPPETACPPLEQRRHCYLMGPPPAETAAAAGGEGQTVRNALNTSLAGMLDADPAVLLLGEDLHDPYGGAFKVTTGLSTRFPDRVISTPISEAGITGAAIGLALAGFRPVLEVMFADFLTLAADQIYNHAVKFPGMFPGVRVPLVIRTASGGRRGYGPTHSQSPENLMAAMPGLTVICPSHRHDPGALLRRALDWRSPVVFIEHKLLYGRTVDPAGYNQIAADPADPGAQWFPCLARGPDDPDVTLVAPGYSVLLAEAAAELLAAEELTCQVVVPSLLAPLPRRTLAQYLSRRRLVVVVEEGPAERGFSAELAAVLLEAGYAGAYRRVAAPALPIPAARSLEAALLPSERDVYDAAADAILSNLAFRA